MHLLEVHNGNGGPVKWDDWLLIVYSVLVGLSLTESLSAFSSAPTLSNMVLLVGVTMVVFENWIYLPVYLRSTDITSSLEVSFYLLAVISYSCLPGLYLARIDIGDLHAPEWALISFAAIALCDSMAKSVSFLRIRKKPFDEVQPSEKKLAVIFAFYAVTGLVISLLLVVGLLLLRGSDWSLLVQSMSVCGVWLAIRICDRFVVTRIMSLVFSILWEEPESERLPAR